MPAPDEKCYGFEEILGKELDEIHRRRVILNRDLTDTLIASEAEHPEMLFPMQARRQSAAAPPPVNATPAAPARTPSNEVSDDQPSNKPTSIYRANHEDLLGLAFSGGGIRSATFNLGVLQALAKKKLLHRFDYLSTISGGGYIGAWLAAWIYRRGMPEVEARLGADRKDQPGFKDPPEIGFLREYSNYLTPRTGFLGADTWTAIAIYCRNLLLNQLVLILFIASILLAPRTLTALVRHTEGWLTRHSLLPCLAAIPVLLVLAMVILAIYALNSNMRNYTISPRPNRVLARVIGRVNETDIRVRLIPSDTESEFNELLRSNPPVEIWDPSIKTRKNAAAGPLQCCFTSGAEAAAEGTLRFKSPVKADAGDLVIAVYTAMAHVKWISWAVAIPAFLTAAILACLMAGKHPDGASWINLASGRDWALAGSAIYAAIWILVFVLRFNFDSPGPGPKRQILSVLFTIISPFVAGATGAILLWKLAPTLQHWRDYPAGMWDVLGFGAPIVMLILLASTVIQIGLQGVVFSEPRREWWGRLAAILLIICFVWAAAFALAGYSPLLLLRLSHLPTSRWLAAITWVASTAVGILGGKSAKSGGPESHTWTDILLGVTPYIFIVGLLMLVSLGIHATLMRITDQPLSPPTQETTAIKISGSGERSSGPSGDAAFKLNITQQQTTSVPSEPYWKSVERSLDTHIYWALVICLVASYLLALRVDLNEFSMHYLYRNRLVRCYLGASQRGRVPNPFTGFDGNDDVYLATLTSANRYDGPLPIFGAALNLVHGKDLAWQERKAESFVMTPLFCGFDVWFDRFPRPGQWSRPGLEKFGYRRTQHYAYPEGLFVGTAMAISGAAASPNMGYHSSPALGFLMTIFNVRLGWWVGNPRHRRSWQKAGPLSGLGYLLVELFGQTDDERKYVYLSDGGHFENLGIYELVKRRCRFILASDAGADKKLTFDDLASAIRKCRSDMGIEIKIRTDRLCASGDPPFSKWHCAVGEIQYQGSDPDAKNGILVYIKASLTSDEPTDVLNYKSRYPDFPHQSTADQWFTESQFEGYRALGNHVIESVLKGLADLSGATDHATVDDLFAKLKTFWENDEEIQALRWPPNTGP
jgi:patatin-like phospholipase